LISLEGSREWLLVSDSHKSSKKDGVPLIRPSNLDALKEMRLGDGTPPRRAFIYCGN
jgi:hypothetical protein